MTDPATAPDADEVARAAEGVPGVVGLHAGPYGEVATYLAGRRVQGVQLSENRVSVHVIGRWGTPLHKLGDNVRAAVEPVAQGQPVDVVIEEVVGDDDGANQDPRRR